MIVYNPIKEELETEELGKYTSWGICAQRDGDLIAIIPDISTDENKVRQLAELCTSGGLSPLHLADVVEDFLNQ